MQRGGASILTGALLFSLLLSPHGRSSPEASATTSTSQQAAEDQNGGVGNPKHQAGKGVADRSQIENTEGMRYENDLTALVKDECKQGDFGRDDSGKGPCHLTPGNFIVALVPDPAHTHLALFFDRTSDAIEEAMQDEGYLLVRAKMPWDPKAHPESDEYLEREQTEWAQDAKENYPGLMVFRTAPPDGGQSSNSKVLPQLFVLVVGESPTGGVHKTQFQNALNLMQKLIGDYPAPGFSKNFKLTDAATWHVSPGQPGLRILGPTFSGSLASLAELLQCEPSAGHTPPNACYPSVSIHSGTVSSGSAIDAFVRNEPSLNANFISFQESDDVIIERFVEFLTGTHYGERDYKKSRIVLLSEDETAYGTGLKLSDDCGSNKDFHPLQAEQDWEAYGNIGNWWPQWLFAPMSKIRAFVDDPNAYAYRPTYHPSNCVLTLSFPREISQLRSAYQKYVADANSDSHSAVRDILPPFADVTGSDDDTVPQYSSHQLPLSQEAVMQGIVSELARHRAQYVLVRATDPTDTLFLIRYLRTAYPQARVVTLGADMLYRREAENPRLHGVLSLSTYSLAPAADHGFADYAQRHAERIFPSHNEAGTYNATRSLLGAWVTQPPSCVSQPLPLTCAMFPPVTVPQSCRSELQGQRDPSQPPLLYQYGWREGADSNYGAPPVRLLALGRDQYWPVAALGPFECEAHTTRMARVPNQLVGSGDAVIIPSGWRGVQIIALAMAFFFCWRLWSSSIFSNWQGFAKFAPAIRDARIVLILVYGLTLILILGILMWPALHGAQSLEAVNLEPLLLAAVAAVFAFTLWESIKRIRAPLPADATALPTALYIAGCVAFILACAVLIYGVGRGEPPEETTALVRWYSMLRSVQLASGLSFIMPTFFFVSVWLWWAEYLALGFAVLDWRTPRLPYGMTDIHLYPLLPESLKDHTPTRWRSAMYFAVVSALVASSMFLLMDGHRPIMSLEKNFLENAMLWFFVLAVAGTVSVTLRIWSHWAALRKLLLQLDALPLREEFKRTDEFKWKPIWNMGCTMSQFRGIFRRKLEALECVMNTVPELKDAQLQTQLQFTLGLINQAGTTRHGLRRSWRPQESQIIAELGMCQERLAAAAGNALDFLARHWATQREEAKPLSLAATAKKALDLWAMQGAVQPAQAKLAIPAAVSAGSASHGSGRAVANRSPHDDDDREEAKMRACEHFVCMTYISFLLTRLVRIRSMVIALSGMYVLTLIGISQYPFEPKGSLEVLLVGLLAFIVVVVGIVFAQLHRDATISNLTGTNPGELGLDFYLKMASFIALPLLSLVASQFPTINRFFYSWLQPAFESLNR